MNFLKLLNAHFGVNLRGLQVFVAEQLLDKADVRAPFEHNAWRRCVETGGSRMNAHYLASLTKQLQDGLKSIPVNRIQEAFLSSKI